MAPWNQARHVLLCAAHRKANLGVVDSRKPGFSSPRPKVAEEETEQTERDGPRRQREEPARTWSPWTLEFRPKRTDFTRTKENKTSHAQCSLSAKACQSSYLSTCIYFEFKIRQTWTVRPTKRDPKCPAGDPEPKSRSL